MIGQFNKYNTDYVKLLSQEDQRKRKDKKTKFKYNKVIKRKKLVMNMIKSTKALQNKTKIKIKVKIS